MTHLEINKTTRFIELDALRGIAALIVLVSHYTWAYDHYFNILSTHKFYFRYGDWGVQIFFLISGFVIFMTLEKAKSVKEFAISRFTRLYPTYWVSMILTLGFISFLPFPNWGPFSLFFILKNVTMLQSFMRTDYIDQVYWSLCVEIAFYAIMACIFYFKKLKHIEIICAIWLTLSLVVFLPDFYFKKYLVVLLILKNSPLFLAGIMFYKIKKGVSNVFNHIIIFLSLIIYTSIFYSERMEDGIQYYSLLLILIAFTFFYLLMYLNFNFLKNKVVQFLGSISFPIYLLHNVIGYAIIYRLRMYTDNQFLYFIIPTIFSIGLAYLVSRYVEKPSLYYLKNKLFQVFKIQREKVS